MIKLLLFISIITVYNDYCPIYFVQPIVIYLDECEFYCSCCEELLEEEDIYFIEVRD